MAQTDLIPFPEGWARKQPLRSWLRKIFRVTDTACRSCGTPLTVVRGSTAAYQGLCNTCAVTGH